VLCVAAGAPALQHPAFGWVAGGDEGAGVEPSGQAGAAPVIPARIGTVRDLSRPTLGGAWADVMRQLGFEPHPWQQYRADVQYELVPCAHGMRLAATDVGTMVGRQTGKTAAAGADIVLRGLAPNLPEVVEAVGHRIGPQHIAFTAQDRQSAFHQWDEHVSLIMASEFRRFVANDKPVRTHGSECLNFVNGSSYRIVTPSKHGARGLSLDLVVIDEALTHEAWLLEAIAPTQAQRDGASASFGAQLSIISNAGDERAELLNVQRELGRRAVAEGSRDRIWFEWSCADDDDPLDPAVWARTVPTLDQPEGIPSAFLARQAETMGTDAFAREYLCRTVWSQSRQVIAADVWAELPHRQVDDGDGVLAVEVDNQRTGAAVVAAGLVGGGVGVRVLEQRPGVDWVVGYVAEHAKGRPVVVDGYGPASTLIPALEQAVVVKTISSHDVADAAAGFVDAVVAARIGHTGDPRFQDAVTWLARRQRGDRWVFDRHRGDISTIVAASLAVWLLESAQVESATIW
jgi:hypothetical protein